MSDVLSNIGVWSSTDAKALVSIYKGPGIVEMRVKDAEDNFVHVTLPSEVFVALMRAAMEAL